MNNERAPAGGHRRVLIAGVLWLAIITRLCAAARYVDCESGMDTHDGLSPLTAWRTIGRANEQAYGAGDSILFKRGCVWQGPGFRANGSGSVQAPILVADYGAANLPR